MKKLIVIGGLDGCGKSTQLDLLRRKIPDAHFITFPYYNTDSGRIISDYLNGKFDEKDPKISAYSASIMYATDRYTSFRTHWQALYESGSPLISARYVSSNAIYQMTKLSRDEWDEYLGWLCDLEYVKLGMPRPDLTILLDMPTEVSQKLLLRRYNGDESKKDIHERDTSYLAHCREAALFSAEKFGWSMIPCSENDEPRSIADINAELIGIINHCINE